MKINKVTKQLIIAIAMLNINIFSYGSSMSKLSPAARRAAISLASAKKSGSSIPKFYTTQPKQDILYKTAPTRFQPQSDGLADNLIITENDLIYEYNQLVEQDKAALERDKRILEQDQIIANSLEQDAMLTNVFRTPPRDLIEKRMRDNAYDAYKVIKSGWQNPGYESTKKMREATKKLNNFEYRILGGPGQTDHWNRLKNEDDQKIDNRTNKKIFDQYSLTGELFPEYSKGNKFGFNPSNLSYNPYFNHNYDTEGYDQSGYHYANEYDRGGYDREGYDRSGFNKAGFNRAGYDRAGYKQDFRIKLKDSI